MKAHPENKNFSLITGASGFIGSRLLDYLNKNKELTKIVSRKHLDSPSESIICDFKLENLPQSFLEGVSTVYHLAGYTHDLRNPEKLKDKYYLINVLATINLARISEKMGVKDFVFVSSVKAGTSDIYDEESTEKPEGVYGETKREAELELIKFSKKSNMKISIVRPALVYGPNLKGNLLSMDNAIKSGWFPPLPKLNNNRSMIHVDDLVKAIVLVKKKGLNAEIYNATDGVKYSTEDIYEIFCHSHGKKLPNIRVPAYIFKIVSSLSNTLNHKINKLFGDEYYSSSKLKALGFKANLNFGDLNESLF